MGALKKNSMELASRDKTAANNVVATAKEKRTRIAKRRPKKHQEEDIMKMKAKLIVRRKVIQDLTLGSTLRGRKRQKEQGTRQPYWSTMKKRYQWLSQ